MTPPDPAERAPLVRPFPPPGRQLTLAFRELFVAAEGTEDQKRRLGDPSALPRPWDPASCSHPSLRLELWTWLDEVVVWFNAEYAWDVAGVIPACWPSHPHLVHDIAVLADQRRLAGMALSSDGLEEWHRYAVPAFLERMRTQLKAQCEDQHQPWPARARHTRHTSNKAWQERQALFQADVRTLAAERHEAPQRPTLGLVDLETGEITPV